MFTTLILAVDAVSPAPSLVSQILVGVGVFVCLFGAWRMGRKPVSPDVVEPVPGAYDAPLIPNDPTDSGTEDAHEPTIVRFFEIALLTLLLGYALFDRGFAWFHIPGTPLFLSELTLVLGVFAVAVHRTHLAQAVRRSPSLKLLVAFMAWGLTLLVVMGTSYGIDAIRDSVLWSYGAVAVLAVFLLISRPRRLGRWIRVFSRLIPWIIAWLFVAVPLDSVMSSGAILVPDSQVSLFSHSAGNAGVIAIMCLAFIWLIDRDGSLFSPTARLVLTGVIGALLLFVSLKNRGGFVAGVVGILLILVFMARRRFDMTVILVGTAALLASIALVGQFSVALFGAREVSAEQFFANVTSIVELNAGGHRQTTTTQWRLELWANVLEDVNSKFPLTGYGPGPDLGEIYNVTTNVDVPLRNPHNSHLDVVARMGWVGFALWVLMWSVWALLLLDLRSQLAKRQRFREAGLVAFPLVGAAMILVNAFFDPAIEGPQVGFVLWFLFGLGAALQLLYHGFPSTQESDTVTERPTVEDPLPTVKTA